MVEERSGFRAFILALLACLAIVAGVSFVYQGQPSRATPPQPSTKGRYTGVLPRTFAIAGGLVANYDDHGTELPNSKPVLVDGTKATWKASGEVGRLDGIERLTGNESFTFTGTLDRKTDTITGPATWRLRGQVGNRRIDWRLDGTLVLHFKDKTTVTGTLQGTRVVTETSPGGATHTLRDTLQWTYAGTRVQR